MTQFDVYSIDNTLGAKSKFFMRAPLSTLVAVGIAHSAGADRVRQELTVEGKSGTFLHHNGRGPWAHVTHFVCKAVA